NECFLEVGDNNEIREHVSIHRSSKPCDRTVPSVSIAEVPWTNERPLENRELNAIIGAWFTL
ncbi:hypothetical protein Tco_0989029, partial [Tanacetum coccineum]